jgi:hypothetical protein
MLRTNRLQRVQDAVGLGYLADAASRPEQDPAPVVDQLWDVSRPVDFGHLVEVRAEQFVEDDLPVERDDQVVDVGSGSEIVAADGIYLASARHMRQGG